MNKEKNCSQYDACTFVMPEGAYQDEDGKLRSASGNLLPHGFYQTDDGTLLEYSNNIKSTSLSMQ